MTVQTLAIVVLLVSFFVMIFLRFPIAYAVGLSSVFCMLVQGQALTDVCRLMVKGISSFSLMAVPFFITMGVLMGSGGISEKLIALADACVGWMRGGNGLEVGQPSGGVQQTAGGKAEGERAPQGGGIQLFRRIQQLGGRGAVGEKLPRAGEDHRRGGRVREAEVGAVDAVGGKLGCRLAAEGVGPQLGEERGVPARADIGAAERSAPSADRNAERLGQLRHRVRAQLHPCLAKAEKRLFRHLCSLLFR